MDITIGSLEMFRTHPSHAGNAKLRATQDAISLQNQLKINNYPSKPELEGAEKNRGSFETYLLDAVNSMNSQQLYTHQLQEQIITDPDSVDIHDVTTAMAKAQMSLDLAQTVIDRLVKGWQEISQNR